MSCWFAVGLLDMTPSAQELHHFWLLSKHVFLTVMSQPPTDIPLI